MVFDEFDTEHELNRDVRKYVHFLINLCYFLSSVDTWLLYLVEIRLSQRSTKLQQRTTRLRKIKQRPEGQGHKLVVLIREGAMHKKPHSMHDCPRNGIINDT